MIFIYLSRIFVRLPSILLQVLGTQYIFIENANVKYDMCNLVSYLYILQEANCIKINKIRISSKTGNSEIILIEL